MTMSRKKLFNQLAIFFLLVTLMVCACIKRQVINEKDELQKVDTLACKKVMAVANIPSFNTPIIELKSSITGSGKEQYKRTTYYNNRPTMFGWAATFIPSLAIGYLGYSKISKGSVVMGRDMLGLSVLPPLITFGFSKIVFKKREPFEKPFTFNIPNTIDQVGIQVNNTNFIKPTYPDKNGSMSINLYELLDRFPQSDLNFSFTCTDKSVNLCKTTVSYSLMNKLRIHRLCAEIDTVCFIVDGFQHSLILVTGSLLEFAMHGYNTPENLDLMQRGYEDFKKTKIAYNDSRKSIHFNKTYAKLRDVVPKMAFLFSIIEEFLNYGRIISYTSQQIKNITGETLSPDKKGGTIVSCELDKPLKHDLTTIGLSEMLTQDIWFTLIGGNYSHPFLDIPARRDSIVQEVFNQLSNR